MEELRKVFIDQNLSIKQTLKKMDGTGEKTLFVVNQDNLLLGVVTDGDIRRWILKRGKLNEKVYKIMNKNPITLREGYSIEEAKDIMANKEIECIPIVDIKNKIISAVWWMDFFTQKLKEHQKIDLPVVIMAGGEGTRLAPFTNILPKPLIPIGEKPILELIIDKFCEYECKKFYLSINYKANIIKAYMDDLDRKYAVDYIEEKMPLGTVGSLSLLRNKIKETFFLTNCDILIEADYYDILKFHKENKNEITLVSSMKHYLIPYGICDIKEGGELTRITEKPEYNFLVNTGMYILEPDVLKDIPSKKLYHITDLINSYLKKGKKIGVYPISEKSWVDMGQLEELHGMLKKFGIK